MHYLEQELRDRTGHLANDKLSFRLIEIVYRDFEVKLEEMKGKHMQSEQE